MIVLGCLNILIAIVCVLSTVFAWKLNKDYLLQNESKIARECTWVMICSLINILLSSLLILIVIT